MRLVSVAFIFPTKSKLQKLNYLQGVKVFPEKNVFKGKISDP